MTDTTNVNAGNVTDTPLTLAGLLAALSLIGIGMSFSSLTCYICLTIEIVRSGAGDPSGNHPCSRAPPSE